MESLNREAQQDLLLEQIRPGDLPAPPEVAMQVMRACARDNTTTQLLASLVETDPELTAEILRIVNSPFYGLSREVRDIGNAVTILGQQYLRNMVLCIAVRDSLNQQPIAGIDTAGFWEEALRLAVAASELGQRQGLDRHECFTAGLLQDYGLLALFYLSPAQAGQWEQLRLMDPEQRYQREKELFGFSHDQVMMILAREWELPVDLGIQLGYHHRCDDPGIGAEHQAFCRVLYCADWLAACYSASDKRHVVMQCRHKLQQYAGIGTGDADELLAAIPVQVSAAATALGLGVRDPGDFDLVMQAANMQLAEQNLEFQDLTLKLQKTIRERDRLAAELDYELQMAREVQSALLPQQDDNMPVYGINLNARQLSGDFYDFYEIPGEGIYFALADVSGKGTNAALLMAKTSSLFRCLGKQIKDPGQLLTVINNELCETAVHGMFVTMAAGFYQPASGRLKLVNAGHLPALLIDGNCDIEEMGAQHQPLGILEQTEYLASETVLGQRSLYLYSDGVTEGRMVNGDSLGPRGLQTLLCRAGRLPAGDRLKIFAKQFGKEGFELHDDVTVLLVEGSQACRSMSDS
jgi:serine phosphatase RsbU (regulator of sigma subunit)/HD-like signal output (HDOD) protein